MRKTLLTAIAVLGVSAAVLPNAARAAMPAPVATRADLANAADTLVQNVDFEDWRAREWREREWRRREAERAEWRRREAWRHWHHEHEEERY